MDFMNFDNFIDQIFQFLIMIVIALSVIIPFSQYLKDRERYPLCHVTAMCFYLDSAFVAFITLISLFRSTMSLDGLDKMFDAFITLQIPSSFYGIITLACFIIAAALMAISSERRE